MIEWLNHKFIFILPKKEYYICINCGIIVFSNLDLFISDLNINYYTVNDLQRLDGNRNVLNISCEEMIIKKLLE